VRQHNNNEIFTIYIVHNGTPKKVVRLRHCQSWKQV